MTHPPPNPLDTFIDAAKAWCVVEQSWRDQLGTGFYSSQMATNHLRAHGTAVQDLLAAYAVLTAQPVKEGQS